MNPRLPVLSLTPTGPEITSCFPGGAVNHPERGFMTIEFTCHNIRLDDGTFTKPDEIGTVETDPSFASVLRFLETVFPEDKKHLRLADLGCLEGGHAVEFARMGFQVLAIEVREANIAACNYVKSNVTLPNLVFVKDDAWNIVKHGVFDVVFCRGLFYHMDRPKQFLQTLSSLTKKLLILQTHFATDTTDPTKFKLSPLCENEGLPGRWYSEFPDEESFGNRENHKWSSWDNRRSFWIQREYLLQAIRDADFDLVMEGFDGLGNNIAAAMLSGYYRTDTWGTFIGIKTVKAS